MVKGRRAALLAAATLTCTGLIGTAGPATAAPAPPAETPAKVSVLSKGFSGPRQLSASGKYFYVAESDLGQATRVAKKGGARKVVVRHAPIAQGVVRSGGKIYVASGESNPDADPPVTGPTSRIVVARPGNQPRTFADLLRYELRYNPDNQRQFDSKGVPEDALSNPYYIIKRHSSRGFLVADAGGNDVLALSRRGKVSTFFVPPSVTTGPCAEATDQNSDAGPSCDAVPTGLAYGPNGHLYVSAATGLTPGEGRVYEVDRYGKLVSTLTGFSGPTGVAVDPAGNVYVSELLQGAPAEESVAKASQSGDGLAAPALERAVRSAKSAQAADPVDPATIGQIVKVAPDGSRTYAQVTMPSGLLWNSGKLYASAWSLVPKAGQIVSVDPASFLAQ